MSETQTLTPEEFDAQLKAGLEKLNKWREETVAERQEFRDAAKKATEQIAELDTQIARYNAALTGYKTPAEKRKPKSAPVVDQAKGGGA